MNLIDPRITYSGLKDVNNNKQKFYDIPNFNIIEQSKKLNESFLMFSLPNIEKFNINNIISINFKSNIQFIIYTIINIINIYSNINLNNSIQL